MNRTILCLLAVVIIITSSVVTAVAQDSTDHAPVLNKKMQFLSALVNKTWMGTLTTPDGKSELQVDRRFSVIWDGMAIKIAANCEELHSEREGFIYWDPANREIRMFQINNRGIIQTGVVTEEDSDIVFSGEVTFPEKIVQYRNVFHFTSDGALIDNWFSLEGDEWRPGHTIELRAED